MRAKDGASRVETTPLRPWQDPYFVCEENNTQCYVLYFTKMVAKIVANLISCQFFAKISKKHQKRPAKTEGWAARSAAQPSVLLMRPFLVLFAYFCKELATN